jgi:hypothetical protein
MAKKIIIDISDELDSRLSKWPDANISEVCIKALENLCGEMEKLAHERAVESWDTAIFI